MTGRGNWIHSDPAFPCSSLPVQEAIDIEVSMSLGMKPEEEKKQLLGRSLLGHQGGSREDNGDLVGTDVMCSSGFDLGEISALLGLLLSKLGIIL